VGVCTASALLAEWLAVRLMGVPGSLRDYSAAITGVLLGLTLPPGFPLWMAALGGLVSIWLGKTLFGGLGANVFNPALVGRAFLQAAFPVAITTWHAPLLPGRMLQPIATSLTWPFLAIGTTGGVDGATTATPLALMKFEGVATETAPLALGHVAGSAGETGALLIVLCGAYLAWRNLLDWRIPVGILATVALFTALLGLLLEGIPSPWFMLTSGGLMLGAVFMATDMATSPVTPGGVWLFAALIGALTVVIRLWGGLPEGVMYAILLGNALVPLLNQVTQPRVYGTGRKPKGKEGA